MFLKDDSGSSTEVSLEGGRQGTSCDLVDSEVFCGQELVWVCGTFLTSRKSEFSSALNLLAWLLLRSACRAERPV